MPEVAAQVLFEERSTAGELRIGVATLNAERSLNALTLEMIRLLAARLAQWEKDPQIACVVLRGTGEKAFCAGGDVRSLRGSIVEHGPRAPNPQAQAFFSEEYRLDFSIHTYDKPILVWGSGIVMGGGLGLFAGASHRVVTETSRIAMPEITIGLFPDVGGSWFLPRMPRRAGLFLALTGASFNGADARYLGLADYFVRSTDRDALLQRLASLTWTKDAQSNRGVLSSELAALARDAESIRPSSGVEQHAQEIERLTAGESLASVYAAITSYAGEDEWLKKAGATLSRGSPTTAALVWELQRRARTLSLADVFRLELVVAVQCCAHPDLPEGVRALLIDKDNKPTWTPPNLDAVTREWIEEHFTSPWPQGASPLADLAGA